jgi:hypothetical protein
MRLLEICLSVFYEAKAIFPLCILETDLQSIVVHNSYTALDSTCLTRLVKDEI